MSVNRDSGTRASRTDALQARESAARYETVAPDQLNNWFAHVLSEGKACILDVGAGSGRDAAWLEALGHDVLAVEPDRAMLREIERHHPDRNFKLLRDRLPDLRATIRSGLSFDLILLNAVWMFVAPSERQRAFRKLVTLLKPGGSIAMTLRYGPVGPKQGTHSVSTEEIERLARRYGAYVEHKGNSYDLLGRERITWAQVIVRVPDDGTGALPLIRRIVLNDDKSSTYKLALVRSICRVAHSAPGFARETSEHVQVPLGLVALFWLRLYLPLLRQNVPQNPSNTTGFERLGFAKAALVNLETISPVDFRAGYRFHANLRQAMHQALRDACDTIDRMPAYHLTHPDGSRIFPVERRTPVLPKRLVLDAPYLLSFGTLSVPMHLWRAMQRYTVWIEPALIEEWISLTLKYALRQQRVLEESVIRTAMQWSEPERDVGLVRRRAVELLDGGRKLYCVWTGKPLYRSSLDIDHCFPWSTWPCSDLWNLMPSNRQVNQRQKRDLLPNDATLRNAKNQIIGWWETAYRTKSALREQFHLEAKSRLPAVERPYDLQDVFDAMCFQRMRLSNDQQTPEWAGPK